jgi:transposase InsO family protein
MVTPAAERKAVAHLREAFGMSERRTCTRECLALVADTSLSGTRVARELDRLVIERGKPKMVVSDNGSELTSNAILTCRSEPRRMALHRAG